MAAQQGLIAYFDGVLDWSPVRKSRLMIIILTVILLYNWLFQLYQFYAPNPYINSQLIRSTMWVLPVQMLLNLLLMWGLSQVDGHFPATGYPKNKLAQQKSPAASQTLLSHDQGLMAQQLAPYCCTIYYVLSMVGLCYCMGLANMPTGLVMTGTALFGFVLFRRNVIYTAFISSTAIILILACLATFNFIPYAPLFKLEFFYHLQARPFYLVCMIYFALPHFIVIIGFCDILFIQWRQRERNIHHISITDSLTSLLNRRAIAEQLTVRLALNAALTRPVCIVLLDVDFFKKINDTHGHHMGDKALQSVAATLLGSLRSSDQLGRYGGEEFLIILNETSLEQAVVIANRCRLAIADAAIMDESGQRLQLTASFGVSCSVQCGYVADHMVRQADRYLYEAKQQGRNQVVSFLNTTTI